MGFEMSQGRVASRVQQSVPGLMRRQYVLVRSSLCPTYPMRICTKVYRPGKRLRYVGALQSICPGEKKARLLVAGCSGTGSRGIVSSFSVTSAESLSGTYLVRTSALRMPLARRFFIRLTPLTYPRRYFLRHFHLGTGCLRRRHCVRWMDRIDLGVVVPYRRRNDLIRLNR